MFSVWLVMFYRFVYNFSYFFWSLFLLDNGFSGTQMGVILGANSLVSLLASMPSGFVNDKFSSRKLILVGAGLVVAHLLIIFSTLNFAWVLLGFVLNGIGARLLDVSTDTLVLKFAKEAEVGFAKKLMDNFLILRFIGIAGGILVGASLLGQVGFDWVIIANLIGLILFALMALFVVDDTPVSLSLGRFWEDLSDIKVLFFMVGIAIFALHFGAENVAYVPFLEKGLGLEGWQIGAYMSLGIGLMGFWSVLFKKVWEKGMSSGYFLILGMLVSGVFHILMVTDNLWLSLFYRVIHEAGDAAVFMFLYNGMVQLFPQKRMGSNLGILTFFVVIASGVSASIYGNVIDTLGVAAPLWISGLVSLVAAAIMLIGVQWFPKIKSQLFH